MKSVVLAYQVQDNQALQACYGKNRESIEKNSEIDFEKKFYLSVEAEKINYHDSEILLKKSNYIYVGVSFDFTFKQGNALPYYAYYIAYEEKDKTYRMVTQSDCPRAVLDYFRLEKEDLQQTKLYQTYLKKDREYVKQYPEYATTAYENFTGLLTGLPSDMAQNLRFLGVIFLIAIVQMIILCLWAMLSRISDRLNARRRRKIIEKQRKRSWDA